MSLWLVTQRTEGPEIAFPCPCCGEPEASGAAYEQVEKITLLMLVPLVTLRNTFVVCAACGQESISEIGVADLEGCSAEELAGRLRPRRTKGSPVGAVLALLAFWVPLAGLAVTVFSMLRNWKAGGWKKWGSLVALLLSLSVHAVIVFSMMGS